MASATDVMAKSAIAAGSVVDSPLEKSKQSKARRPVRPNYHQIHQSLLPVEVFPLPTLIPHNPLSLVAIALSYLTRLISPPARKTYDSYFSSTTSSIHVTDHDTIRALWEMGFFGRGSLSRSEPTWQQTQVKKGLTAEENTRQRRDERRQVKLERAKKEQEEIAEQLSREQSSNGAAKEHVLSDVNSSPLKTNDGDMQGIASVLETAPDEAVNEKIEGFEEWKLTVAPAGLPTPPPTTASEGELDRPVKRLQRSKTVRFSPTIEAREFDLSSPIISPIKSPGSSAVVEEVSPPKEISTPESENKEHLNLSLEEAFFLSYGLGLLNVYCEESDTVLSPSSLLSLFRRHSYHPTRSLSMPQEPDDPFMLSYAVYHHYRSLGWVVRSGVKFSVDYLLYNRGPAFSHAEFAVVILPAYSHPYWSETEELRKYIAAKTRRSWSWLHGVNRVQAQVQKSLILCYVEIPPPLTKAEKGQNINVGKELSRYTVRDIAVKRWTPNRTRD